MTTSPITATTKIDQIPPVISLLGISASMKPAPDEPDIRSATANVLAVFLRLAQKAALQPAYFDLRRTPLPWFDGRPPKRRTEIEVELCYSLVERAAGICCAVPAYWGGYSGVFKNLIDVLCGANYDDDVPQTVFTGRPVTLIVIGTDLKTAHQATEQAQSALSFAGAQVNYQPLILANPRKQPWDEAIILQSLQKMVDYFVANLCQKET